MKRLCEFAVATVLMFSLVAALAGTSLADTKSLPKSIVLGSSTSGSMFYVVGVALAKTISDHTPIKVDIYPEGGTVWYPMMTTGEVHVGINVPDDLLAAYKGTDIYQKTTKGKGYSFRTLMLGSPLMAALVVDGKSNIKTPQDIKGKRIPVNYGAFYTTTLTSRALLANLGLTQKDVSGLNVSGYVEGVRALIDGRVDVTIGSLGSGIVEELKSARGARYLPMDSSPEAINRLQEVHPGYYLIKVKPGYAAGITEEMYVLGKDITLVGTADLSEDVAYTITKCIWDYYKELAPVHPQLQQWTPDRFASTRAVVPYHAGSIKLYKEKGAWTSDLDEHQKRLLSIK